MGYIVQHLKFKNHRLLCMLGRLFCLSWLVSIRSDVVPGLAVLGFFVPRLGRSGLVRSRLSGCTYHDNFCQVVHFKTNNFSYLLLFSVKYSYDATLAYRRFSLQTITRIFQRFIYSFRRQSTRIFLEIRNKLLCDFSIRL
jgi:hypothetical protein